MIHKPVGITSRTSIKEFTMCTMFLRPLLLAVLVVAAGSALPAQALVATAGPSLAVADVEAPRLVGPRVTPSVIPRTVYATETALEGAMLQQGGDRRNVSMMVVGAAGLVIGSVIGGDAGTIIAISGGVVGLIGLFRYMQ